MFRRTTNAARTSCLFCNARKSVWLAESLPCCYSRSTVGCGIMQVQSCMKHVWWRTVWQKRSIVHVVALPIRLMPTSVAAVAHHLCLLRVRPRVWQGKCVQPAAPLSLRAHSFVLPVGSIWATRRYPTHNHILERTTGIVQEADR